MINSHQLLQIILALGIYFLPIHVIAQENAHVQKQVLILGSHTDYKTALKAVISLSKKSNIYYATRGLEYNSKKGLYWPENNNEPSGDYMARRYNEDCDKQASICLTIEKSEYYAGFTPKLYIIVGGIYDKNAAEAKTDLAMYKKFVSDAYLKETSIYMGCLH